MRRGERGFTLIEVIVALGLSMMVLVGVLMVTTDALRAHYEQVRSGQDSTAEMYGIDNMVTNFENTTHLEPHYPDAAALPWSAGGQHTEVRGCIDWSEAMAWDSGNWNAGMIDGIKNNTSFYDYCWTAPGGAGPGGRAALWMYDSTQLGPGSGCPALVVSWNPVTCGTPVYGITPDVVALDFYPVGYPTDDTIFTRNWAGGIDMTFMVGIATSDYSGAGVSAGYKTVAMPVIYRMSTGSGMEKNYNVPTCGGNPCD